MDYSATSTSPSFPNATPFVGIVENTIHALRLVQAARQGMIPRIIRRLNDSERREMITSGAVFVFSVEESGIKRWTDSMVWSPSRIVGNFLVYKEMWERTGGRAGQKRAYPPGEDQSRMGEQGSPTTNGPLKVNGLIKKTITVTIDGSDLHLISYYTQDDLQTRRLRRISSRPDIATLELQAHMFRFSSFRNPPKVVIGRDGRPTVVCEPEEPELLETFTPESPDRTSYSPVWPDSTEEQRFQQDLTSNQSFVRGRRATVPSGPFLDNGWQGQYGSMSMLTHEEGGEFHRSSAGASGMQRSHDQVDHRRPSASYGDGPSQRSWPQSAHPVSSARYDSMSSPFGLYHHRSRDRENERDTVLGGQTLMTAMRDEHAPMFGNQAHYMAQDRYVGYDQPPWSQTNQNVAQQGSLSGIQNSFSSSGQSSPNVPQFTVAHNQENIDGQWSARQNGGPSYELQYPEPDLFQDATQEYGQNFYSTKQTTTSSDSQLYNINDYNGRGDMGDA